jgi:hypothetical protein
MPPLSAQRDMAGTVLYGVADRANAGPLERARPSSPCIIGMLRDAAILRRRVRRRGRSV